MSYFGPFEIAFQAKGPGYMELLGGPDGADVLVEGISKALAAPNAARFVGALLSGADWRPHLVGAVAHLLDQTGKLHRDLLWRAIDAGSWVTPQLVVTAALCDERFAMKARRRVEQGCLVSAPNLTSLERHVLTGPAGIGERSGKMLASILGICAVSPILKELESGWRQDARLIELLTADVDHSDLIARSWMASAQRLLLKRGSASPHVHS